MTWRVTWTEVSEHSADLDDEEMARLLGISVEELAEAEVDDLDRTPLYDGLAEVDGFDSVEREGIEIERM